MGHIIIGIVILSVAVLEIWFGLRLKRKRRKIQDFYAAVSTKLGELRFDGKLNKEKAVV